MYNWLEELRWISLGNNIVNDSINGTIKIQKMYQYDGYIGIHFRILRDSENKYLVKMGSLSICRERYCNFVNHCRDRYIKDPKEICSKRNPNDVYGMYYYGRIGNISLFMSSYMKNRMFEHETM